MAGNSSQSGRSVVSKVIAVLLTYTSGDAYSLTEIARLTGLPVSTTYRLILELAAWGFLERNEDGRYRVGDQLRVIGSEAVDVPTKLRERVRQVMRDIVDATSRTAVGLGVLEGGEVIYVDNLPGCSSGTMFAETAPAHATATGKAILAFSPPPTVGMIISRGLRRYTPFTLTTPERLRRSLSVTRLTGVAVSRCEFRVEMSAVAVPIFGGGGNVIAALEVEVRDPHDLHRMQAPLIVAARVLSRDLAAGRLGVRCTGAN